MDRLILNIFTLIFGINFECYSLNTITLVCFNLMFRVIFKFSHFNLRVMFEYLEYFNIFNLILSNIGIFQYFQFNVE